MIIQMTKRTVYYPAPYYKTADLPGGTRRVKIFRTAVLVNGKRFSGLPHKI
jgi:hypothetical protein